MFHNKKMVKYITLDTLMYFIIGITFICGSFWVDSASASSIKFKHGPGSLTSTLSGRPHDYNSAQGGHVISAGSSNNGDAGSIANEVSGRSDTITSNGLDGTTVSGVGEVFVPKTFPLSSQEPTCEELRAMWIFSKRQSRAAEITNEIPTYRDPFTYNVWEPNYASPRSFGPMRMGSRDRSRSPVFGRIVNREPQRITFTQRQRYYSSGSSNNENAPGRLYGQEGRQVSNGSGAIRRPTQNRYIGGANGSTTNGASINQNTAAVQGSFQKLKELIWTERAKELTQQRRAEELAARAAVLKEIANGQNIPQSSYKPSNIYKSESPLMDENRSPDMDSNQYMNDERISIANGQSLSSIRKVPQDNINRAAARSYSNRFGHLSRNTAATHKSSIFPEDQPDRLQRLRLPGNTFLSSTVESELPIGVTKSFPMKQSHFRERNRSLFKQFSPMDYFQRALRSWNNPESTYALQQISNMKNMNNFVTNKFGKQFENRLDEHHNENYPTTNYNDNDLYNNLDESYKFVSY